MIPYTVTTTLAFFLATKGGGVAAQDISDGTLTVLAEPPYPPQVVHDLVWGGDDDFLYGFSIYAEKGYFLRYSIPADVWDFLSDPPVDALPQLPSKIGSWSDDTTWDKDDTLYAMGYDASNHRTFQRYLISEKQWQHLHDPPHKGSYSSLVWGGNKNLYWVRGDLTQDFFSYSVDTWEWHDLAPTPIPVVGATLLWTGGNNIYMLQLGSPDLYLYSISGNSWTQLSSIPDSHNFNGGPTFAYLGGNYLYALAGTEDHFMRYSVCDDEWRDLGTFDISTPHYAMIGTSTAIYIHIGSNFWRYTPFYSCTECFGEGVVCDIDETEEGDTCGSFDLWCHLRKLINRILSFFGF